jgi:phosphatidylserine decarboxylase
MVSPADGLVSDVGEVDSEHAGERCLRIGIFLSVFNVHVNRAPCDGKVTAVVYKKGKFINAMSHNAASSDNESNTIVLSGDDGRTVAVVKQIVGLIARRIICTSQQGDTVKRGDRIGMIKFGSRTELYIPLRLNPTASVQVGQKVRGGMDIIAKLAPAAAPAAAGVPA